jgi:hypothetical protein
VTSISDRAHARDYAEHDAEKRRREAAYRNAYSLLWPLSQRYVARCRQLGSDDPLARLLLVVSDFVLDEINAKGDAKGDIPVDVAAAILALVERA